MKTADIIAISFAVIIILGLFVILNPGIVLPSIKNSASNLPWQASSAKKAPELQGISGYINTNGREIKLSDYLGKKVILVDFWTYTCINCIRTFPYLKQWDEKYRDEGLQIIGVHSPEFDFEKNYSNVENAVEQYGLKYPVVQDNEHATWNAYENRYWPAKYLIDKNGNIVYMHFGEGNYDESERQIQLALADLKNASFEKPMATPNESESVDFGKIGTPEIYFGYEFKRAPLGNDPFFMQPGDTYQYALPSEFSTNQPYLEGTWRNNNDNAELVGDSGRIILLYYAKNVNIVAGSENGSSLISSIDDAKHKVFPVKGLTLYRAVDEQDYGFHRLELNITGKGFKMYTFTFG
jgi:thiol-disulfide isomerase/thioredoxin